MSKKDGRISITPITGIGPIAFSDGTYGVRREVTQSDDYPDNSRDHDRRHVHAEDRLALDKDPRLVNHR